MADFAISNTSFLFFLGRPENENSIRRCETGVDTEKKKMSSERQPLRPKQFRLRGFDIYDRFLSISVTLDLVLGFNGKQGTRSLKFSLCFSPVLFSRICEGFAFYFPCLPFKVSLSYWRVFLFFIRSHVVP